ncbi:MAG: RNA methyltransferase [Nitrosomonadales bacterium]|nr:MAG: RNA methyltransferase [Nitrosomonadales bacterium]
MKLISSRDNPIFKRLKRLAESARERRKTGLALLDGAHLFAACLDMGAVPQQVVFSAEGWADDEIRALLQKVPAERRVELAPALLAELSPVETPSGVLVVIEILHLKPPTQPEFCLLLEDVQDPGNLGSMLRSAAAAGVQAAYLSSGCADAWSPKALRGGMGAHFVLTIEERVPLAEKVAGFAGLTVAAGLQAGKSLYDLDLRGPVAFLVGNEGAGLSAELLAAVRETVTIPMPGKIESLNAAAAAAVCMFERVRQLR